MNPAPAEFATATVTTDAGPLVVPCEPINEWLAITPAFGMDREGHSWLMGTFAITHRPTGLSVSESAACIHCCRRAGQVYDALASADWPALEIGNGTEWAASLTPEDRRTLALYRALEWLCDAELCPPAREDAPAEELEETR